MLYRRVQCHAAHFVNSNVSILSFLSNCVEVFTVLLIIQLCTIKMIARELNSWKLDLHKHLVSKNVDMGFEMSSIKKTTPIFTTGIYRNGYCLDILLWYSLHISIQNDLIQLCIANFNGSLEVIMHWLFGINQLNAWEDL